MEITSVNEQYYRIIYFCIFASNIAINHQLGAAKAYERAAGLLMDITDQSQLENTDKQTLMSTIECLESAIYNYDVIHKYKHAGTLHYRCSKLLSMMNANHKLVEQHHIKALEYFTKPDHELKQRKRIDVKFF